MGNGSSKYSSRHYDYRPFTGPVIPPPSQMTHANSYASGSTLPSYDMPRRRRRKWYQFGSGRDRHRGQDIWYSAYVSPRGQQPPTQNPFGQFFVFHPILTTEKLIHDHEYGPVGLPPNAVAYQGPPDRQRNPTMPMPIPMHYGSLHIPDGYIPPSVNPPVVPRDVTTPTTESEYWRRAGHPQHPRRPSQGHYRRPSQSHPPVQPVNPTVMPPQPFTEPMTSTRTSSLTSPPFKPFQPLPEMTETRLPTPPQKLLDLPPYRETLSHLSRASSLEKTRAVEILQNREERNIKRAREEWKKQDEEREKAIREKKEERERFISGVSTLSAPTMQTVTALVVDPATTQQPPPLPKKEKKSFWRKLFRPGKSKHSKQQPAATQHAVASRPVIIPIGPQQVLPSIPRVAVPMQPPASSQSYTSSTSSTYQNPEHTVQPTSAPPVIPVSPGRVYAPGVTRGARGQSGPVPSPFLQQRVGSTTPDNSPPPAAGAFFSIPATVNM